MRTILFDSEPQDDFKCYEGAEPHMCLECKHLKEYHSQLMIDTCKKVEEVMPRNKDNWTRVSNRAQRFDVQKIGIRKCRYFDRNNVPDWWISTLRKQIEGTIAFYERHYTGD